jgi:translation initiation factor IF-3
MDFGKYKYQQSKKAQIAKKKQKIILVKEIKVRPKTDTHDLEVKAKHARRFLSEGNKIKVTVRFRGREFAHTDRGHIV